MALYYGVPEDEMVYDAETGITSFEQGQTIPEDRFFAMNIDIVDGQKARRFAMPRCQITDRDDVTYKRGENDRLWRHLESHPGSGFGLRN